MRISLYFVFIGLFLVSCDQKSKQEPSEIEDTTWLSELDLELRDSFRDTICCRVEHVEEFAGSNQYIFELSFRKGHRNLFEYLLKFKDSLLYDDGDQKLWTIERSKEKYFNLIGGDFLMLDERGRFVGSGNLDRVGYFEDNITAGYVALLKLKEKPKSSPHALISRPCRPGELWVEPHQDTRLDSILRSHLRIDSASVTILGHYQTSDSLTYSFAHSDTTSFVLEIENEARTVYHSPYNEVITAAYILPIEREGRPVILIRSGAVATDVVWSTVLVFNGSSYVANSGDCIP